MAGLYPKLLGCEKLPQGVDVRVVIDREDTHGTIVSKKMDVEDTHGHWLSKDLDELKSAGRRAFQSVSTPVELVVMLNAHDRIVPSVLARYVKVWAKRLTRQHHAGARRETVKEAPHNAPPMWLGQVAPAA